MRQRINWFLKSGFTLVEVLIVIVILSILAALVLPRLTSQPERARAIGGTEFLGALKRAQQRVKDSGDQTAYVDITTASTQTTWDKLGLTMPASGGFFAYTCGSGSCIATRNDTPTGNSKNTGTMTINIDTGAITCDGTKYKTAPSGTGCA